MEQLSQKKRLEVDRALHRMSTGLAFLRTSDARKLPFVEIVRRKIDIGSGRAVHLSDLGLELERIVVSAIHDGDVYEGDATFSDIWTAFHNELGSCLTKNARLAPCEDLIKQLWERIEPLVRLRTFVVAIHGVGLKDIDSMQLGSLVIVRPSEGFIRSHGVKDSDGNLSSRVKQMGTAHWIVGTCRGTPDTALQRFAAKARLATGMLAVAAAATHTRGANAFRIVAAMSAEDGVARCDSLYWDDVDKSLGWRIGFRKAQTYTIDKSLLEQLREPSAFAKAFKVFEEPVPTGLQKAIARAVFWFADAHLDSLAVMRFVKYWSCIEVFFSMRSEGTTKAVSIGVAAVLTFGGFGFLPEVDYQKTKARVAKLYTLRSRAVHRASHQHVTEHDVAELSQWTAWLIINMIEFAESNYSLDRVLRESFDLDAKRVAAARLLARPGVPMRTTKPGCISGA